MGLTSEQRAAVAVHNATQNRMCLNLSGNGQICVACSEVADQIDEAVAVALVGVSEALSEKEAALAAARRALTEAAKVAESMLDRDDTSICVMCGADINNGEPSCDANCFRVKLVAALAAPAAGRDPAIEDADAMWRDGEAHGRDK